MGTCKAGWHGRISALGRANTFIRLEYKAERGPARGPYYYWEKLRIGNNKMIDTGALSAGWTYFSRGGNCTSVP